MQLVTVQRPFFIGSILTTLASCFGSKVTVQAELCPSGPPPQWRPHLDMSSKAHLAPVIVIGKLEHLNMQSVSVHQSGSSSILSSSLVHLQPATADAAINSINNNGFHIEASFKVLHVIKNSLANDNSAKLLATSNGFVSTNPGYEKTLAVNDSLMLAYKVSESLSTTNTLMTLAHSNDTCAEKQQDQSNYPLPAVNQKWHYGATNSYASASYKSQVASRNCALELGEKEFVRRATQLFCLNQEYILFLSASSSSLSSSSLSGNSLQWASISAGLLNQPTIPSTIWHAYATHEPVTNASKKALVFGLSKRHKGK